MNIRALVVDVIVAIANLSPEHRDAMRGQLLHVEREPESE